MIFQCSNIVTNIWLSQDLHNPLRCSQRSPGGGSCDSPRGCVGMPKTPRHETRPVGVKYILWIGWFSPLFIWFQHVSTIRLVVFRISQPSTVFLNHPSFSKNAGSMSYGQMINERNRGRTSFGQAQITQILP